MKALVEAMKECGLEDGLVLCWDDEANDTAFGKRIAFVPLWKWLLEVEKVDKRSNPP